MSHRPPSLPKSFPRPLLLTLAVFGFLLTSTLLFGEGKGVIPGPGNSFPKEPAKKAPSCGQCHGSFPNSRGVLSFFIQANPDLQVGKKLRATLRISSLVSGSKGGFNMQTDRGSFTPLGNTRINQAGTMLTHSNSQSRTWSFDFSSPTAGLVQWWIVGNTVNGNGRNDGDSWSWYAPNPALGLPGYPYRLFVNASQVFPYGKGCQGERGIVPILGARQNASLGKSFLVETYNLPPSSAAFLVMGFSDTAWGAIPLPFQLDPLGMKGCSLYTSPDFFFPAATVGTGVANAQASFALPLPSSTALRGAKLFFQVLALDPKSNSFGMTSTSAIKAVIQ